MIGMEYGNTRLRAKRSRMLGAADYRRLTTVGSVDALLAALSDSDYAVDVEAALTRYGGLRRLDEVIRRHLERVLGSMGSFYEEPAIIRVDLLLERWDLRNLRVVLRGRARLEGADDILRLVVPVGRLSSAELTELAMQPSLRTTVDLMAAWRIPSRPTARRLLDAWPEYEATGDIVVLEGALNRAFAERLDDVLGDDAGDAATVLRSEIDEINLLTALRLRAARDGGEVSAATAASVDPYLPAGRIRPADLAAVATTTQPSDVLVRLDETPIPAGWIDVLRSWVDHGELGVLADDLHAASTIFAVGLFHRGDPLGFDIPVAFARAEELEARNLRWIGRGVAHELDVAEIERRVVVIT